MDEQDLSKATSKNGLGKLLIGALIGLLLGGGGATIYFQKQLDSFKAQEQEFKAYQKNKQEQQAQLEQLQNDNEKMLRDMSELSNLEKKLRRALMRDVDNKLTSGLDKDTSLPQTGYTGKGGPKDMDVAASMAALKIQNKNLQQQIELTKKSVSELLGEMEGRSGTLASFPNKWPTVEGVISSSYGARTGPIEGGYDWHPGIDIAVDYGTPVFASGAGVIMQAGVNGGYGRYVKIDHQNGYETAYGHMSSLAVKAGQRVAKGEIIGFAGSTGYSTGPHVHFEVFAEGQTVDPYFLLKK